jgi:hypothetical protein
MKRYMEGCKLEYGKRLTRTLKGMEAGIDSVLKKTLRGYLFNLCNSLFILLFLILFLFYSCFTHASTNIPLDSPFYDDIGILIAQGLIESDLSSTRPFTRAEGGRLIAEAISSSEFEDIPYATSILLDRIAENFEVEISKGILQKAQPGSYLKPLDEFSIRYYSLDGPFSIFNKEGIDYFDGSNVLVQFQSRAGLWNVFSFYIQPLFLYNENYKGIEGNDDTTIKMHKAYVKFTIDNFEIQWGKDTLWWGPGYHGALLMSDNAWPFTLLKVSNPRAALLPWIFSYLGPFRYTLFFSELDNEAESDHPPNSQLLGARLDFKPHPLLELGASYLAHFDGDRLGIGGLDFYDYRYIIFSNERRDGDKRDSNKEFAIDAALTIPDVSEIVPLAESIKLYGELGAEDQGGIPERQAYLVGMAFNNIFTAHGLKLVTEYANLSPQSDSSVWYEHTYWPMKYYGRVFGHHAGTDSDDIFFELSHKIKDKFTYKIGFDKERNGISKEYVQQKYQYIIEVGYDLTRWLNISMSFGYEEIENVDNVEDRKEENRFIGTEVNFSF